MIRGDDLSTAYDEPHHDVHGGPPDHDLAPVLDGFRRIAEAATDLREFARPCADCGLYSGHRGGCAVAGLH